jgi:glycosyltransferase involved in cell wall biosynthesis
MPSTFSTGNAPGTACIVFSKDRPLQLDAALRSLKLNCADSHLLAIRVLCKTSTPHLAAQYRVLATEHDDVTFVREANFKQDLVALTKGSTHVLVLVDDTLVVGSLSVARTIQVLDDHPATLGFSFRLGRNTTYCYTLDKQQGLPAFEEPSAGVLTFDWTGAEHDFGYPLEISSSLYRASDILPLLVELEYRDPNTLESALALRADSFRETHPRLACFQRSVAFSVPANLVQTAWKNRVDDNPALTAKALGDAYARGQRLDIARYQGFVANACHQELDFHYTQRPDVPIVSIVIACYKQAEYLPDAVTSVVGQTFTDWEVIIVDDGSPDRTVVVAQELIEMHPGRRIRLLRQRNQGLAAARNAGISVARGRYLLPLDADDAIDPEMLATCVDRLAGDTRLGIVYTDQQRFGAEDRHVPASEFRPFLMPDVNQPNYCALYRREVWESIGGYNENMVHGYEDWDFWLGAIERGIKAARVPEPLFRYRIRPGTMYETALDHDTELRRQLRANHPRLYRPWLCAARYLVQFGQRARSRAFRIAKSLTSTARRNAA